MELQVVQKYILLENDQDHNKSVNALCKTREKNSQEMIHQRRQKYQPSFEKNVS
jgi:hypothetical protein